MSTDMMPQSYVDYVLNDNARFIADDLPVTTFAPLEQANDNLPVAGQLAGAPQRARIGDFMQTFTGRQFWSMDPRADEIFIEDIAHSLAMQCRFAGHCIRFYSVAEHSVLLARWLLPKFGAEVALAGLLHDASEAFLVDVPRPVKPYLAGYKDAEANVMAAVCERFGLPLELPFMVHEADGRIIADERANLRPCVAEWAPTGEPLGVKLQLWSPEIAELYFLDTFRSLTKEKARRAA